MGDHAADFLTRFHALEGDLIGERKKNFSKLLRDLNSLSDKHLIDDIFKKLQPKTYLESLFKIDALIYFRKIPELLDIIKEGNEIFVSKIIKHLWFIEEVFKDIDADKVVNEFLPSMPFKFRMKVLKKFSMTLKEEEQMDELYSLVYNRYGLWIARNILHKCSAEKIMKVLHEDNIYLQPNQVKHLFDRNTVLFEQYLDYYKEASSDSYSHCKVLNYVAFKNPGLLIDLEKKSKIRVDQLGRRTSKKVFDVVKDEIPEKMSKYEGLINNAVLIRKLGEEFEDIYDCLFPTKVSNINSYNQCNRLLRFYPKNKRWQLFTQTFSSKFDDEYMTDVLKNFCESFFDFNPGKTVIRRWAEIKYFANNKDDFLKYMDPEISIPLLKEKINVTSDINKRKTLIDLLLDTCARNQDLNMLEEILKYICFRHRNELVWVRRDILDKIRDLFKPQDFNENHWKYINEQIELLRITNEFQLYRHSALIQRYLEYLFINSKDYKSVLMQYINDMVYENNCYTLNLKNPEIERQIYMEILKVAPDIPESDEFPTKPFQISLIRTFIGFNEANPEYFINLAEHKYISEYIYGIFGKTDDFEGGDYDFIDSILYYRIKFPEHPIPDDDSIVSKSIFCVTMKCKVYLSVITKMITKTSRTDFENELLEMYFENIFDEHPRSEIVSWFLTNEPRILIPYFKKIMEKTYLNLDVLKLYSHFNFDEQITELYKVQLDTEKIDNKINIMRNLIILLPTDDFIAIVNERFLPTKEKVDLEDKQMKEIYRLQCDVAKELHKVKEPAKMLPVILKFCVGDYLQSSLRALYSLFHRFPENQLYPYVDILAKRSVSVRKHAVFLTCDILEHKLVVDILTATKQRNVSSQKHLFSATLKYFQKNPSQQLLNLLITNMSTIDKNDTEALQSLVKKSVPKKYKVMYVEKCWGFYESLEKSVNIKDYLDELWYIFALNSEIIVALSPSFIKKILENYFGNTKNYWSDSYEFAILVLNLRESERTENFEIIFKKVFTWRINDIDLFFNCFTQASLGREFVELFAKYWNDYFTRMKTFNEHIFLKFYLIHFSYPSVEDFTVNIILYVEELVSEFGPYIYDTIKYVFKDFINKKRANKRYEIYYQLLKLRINQFYCLLVLDFLQPVCDDDVHLNKIYQNIMEILGNTKEPIVNLYYERYVRAHQR